MKTRFMFCRTRAESFAGRPLHEYNDCTVISLVNLTGMPYGMAHDIAKAAGRKSGHGASVNRVVRQYCQYTGTGYERRHLFDVTRLANFNYNVGGYYRVRRPSPYPTLAQVLKTLPTTGRFLLTLSDHVFAVVAGVVMDNQPISLRRRVIHIYTLTSF